MNVIDAIAPTLPALLRESDGVKTKPRGFVLHLAGAQIHDVHPGFFTRLLNTLIDPNILTLLFLAGLAGIGYEIFHPGVVLPGALGLVALITALFGFSVLPRQLGRVHPAARGRGSTRARRARDLARGPDRGRPDRDGRRRDHASSRTRLRHTTRRRRSCHGRGRARLVWAFAVGKAWQVRHKPVEVDARDDRRRGRRGPPRRARLRQRRALAGAHAGGEQLRPASASASSRSTGSS
jgi:hypothetical protein